MPVLNRRDVIEIPVPANAPIQHIEGIFDLEAPRLFQRWNLSTLSLRFEPLTFGVGFADLTLHEPDVGEVRNNDRRNDEVNSWGIYLNGTIPIAEEKFVPNAGGGSTDLDPNYFELAGGFTRTLTYNDLPMESGDQLRFAFSVAPQATVTPSPPPVSSPVIRVHVAQLGTVELLDRYATL